MRDIITRYNLNKGAVREEEREGGGEEEGGKKEGQQYSNAVPLKIKADSFI